MLSEKENATQLETHMHALHREEILKSSKMRRKISFLSISCSSVLTHSDRTQYDVTVWEVPGKTRNSRLFSSIMHLQRDLARSSPISQLLRRTTAKRSKLASNWTVTSSIKTLETFWYSGGTESPLCVDDVSRIFSLGVEESLSWNSAWRAKMESWKHHEFHDYESLTRVEVMPIDQNMTKI